jgi:CRISPR-associated exonuclease Cas4
MLDMTVPRGALFYGLPRRRTLVEFTPQLRSIVEQAAARIHELVRSGVTPPGHYEKKCRGCSLFDICLPQAIRAGRSAAEYLEKSRRAAASLGDS